MTNELIITLPKSKTSIFISDFLQYFIEKDNKMGSKNLIKNIYKTYSILFSIYLNY